MSQRRVCRRQTKLRQRGFNKLTNLLDPLLTGQAAFFRTNKKSAWVMGRLSYDSADVLIYDPVPANRAATRAALYALGFRRTVNVSTLEAFVDAIQRNPPDIALCEADEGGEQLCGTIQQLRQGGTCINPFIVIIVTAWDKSSALINRVVSSGADDLLLRPFSTAVLGNRIEAHI